MINFVLIGLCIGLGFLFRTYKITPPEAHKGINIWVLYIGLPAVSLKYIPTIQWGWDMMLPALAPFVIWFGARIYSYYYAKSQLFHTPSQAAMTFTSGLSNTSFVGFPLIIAYFGEKYLSIAIICDQVTFTIFSTLGLIHAIGSSKTSQQVETVGIFKKLLYFPPFMGCILALVLPNFIDLSPAKPLFSSLAATVSPLALFSVGLQLQFSGWLTELKHISVALLYKLFLAPILVTLLALALGLLHSEGAKMAIFEAAMPTLISSSIMAEKYQLNTKLTNLVIGISIVLSLLTTGIWFVIINWLC